MKTYGSIGKDYPLNKEVWLFDKPDGSNVRAYWEYKKGFTQFGSRYKIIDSNTLMLSKAIPLIIELEEKFNKLFLDNKIKSATCFFEFFGASSQFGQHIETEAKQVQLSLAVGTRNLACNHRKCWKQNSSSVYADSGPPRFCLSPMSNTRPPNETKAALQPIFGASGLR